MKPAERDTFVFDVINIIDVACETYGWNINCFRCYLEVKKIYPEAEAKYNGDHVIFDVRGHIFDKHGQLYYPFKVCEPEKYKRAFDWGDINPDD